MCRYGFLYNHLAARWRLCISKMPSTRWRENSIIFDYGLLFSKQPKLMCWLKPPKLMCWLVCLCSLLLHVLQNVLCFLERNASSGHYLLLFQNTTKVVSEIKQHWQWCQCFSVAPFSATGFDVDFHYLTLAIKIHLGCYIMHTNEIDHTWAHPTCKKCYVQTVTWIISVFDFTHIKKREKSDLCYNCFEHCSREFLWYHLHEKELTCATIVLSSVVWNFCGTT